MNAAEGLFAERGPDAVGIKQVAEAAGVSHPLVVHYFGSYEALVHEVLRRRNRQLADEVLRGMLTSEGPLDARSVLTSLLAALGNPVHARLLAWAALSGNAERLALVRNAGVRRIVDALEVRLRLDAEARGGTPPTRERLDKAVLVGASAVLGFVTCGAVIAPGMGITPGPVADEAFRDALHELLRPYLAGEKGPPARRGDAP